MLGVTTVAAVQGLGNLLLVALDPRARRRGAAGLRARLPPALALAVGLAALAGILGLLLSFHLEIAAGASVALCAVGLAGSACRWVADRPIDLASAARDDRPGGGHLRDRRARSCWRIRRCGRARCSATRA